MITRHYNEYSHGMFLYLLNVFSKHTDKLIKSRTDFAYSSTWSNKPIFPLITHLSGTLSWATHLLHNTPPSILSLGPLAFPELAPHVFETMHNLSLISAAITSYRASPASPPVDRRSISNAVYSAEHRLLSLRMSSYTDDDDIQSISLDFSQVLLLAAHLYMHLAIRELPGTAKMHLKMLYDLKSSITLNFPSLFFQASDAILQVLLWILFIGAVASTDLNTRSFFVQNLQQVCTVLGVETEVDFQSLLKGVLWLDGFCLVHCARVWREMNAGDAFLEGFLVEEVL
jgi:hypothetical protein